jgi:PAS domain S-box-containing protein
VYYTRTKRLFALSIIMTYWLPSDDLLLNNPVELKATLSRYRRLLTNIGYGFWEWDVEKGRYRAGGGFWGELGYEDVAGEFTSADSIQEYVHPDDFSFVCKALMSRLLDDAHIDIVYRIRAKDGTYRWTQASAKSTRNDSGIVTHIDGVNYDLSHLKETEKALRLSESRYERILAASNDGIWEWTATDANVNPRKAGLAGRLHTSHSFWAHLGYSEAEVDALPEDERLAIWISHIHPYDLHKLHIGIRKHFATREPINMEYRIFGEGGKIFWVRTRGHGIFNVHGRLILASGINIDITKIKESEERVERAKNDAEKSDRSKTNFLSSMSHELRTPLNSILGFSTLLAKDPSLDNSLKENINHVKNAGEHLLRLINDILDLSQIEAEKLSLSMGLVKPSLCIKETFNYCKVSASEKNITLIFEDNGLNDIYINADLVRLRQCLINLINNAIKYNVVNGDVKVSFSTEANEFIIAVSDTGPGVEEEKQVHLFEMFNRLGAERSSIEGSGLGLVITEQLMLAMGGKIIYDNDVAVGACFKLFFSISEASSVALPATTALPTSELFPVRLNFVESKNIYYVEDNASNIRLLDAWLKPYPQIHLSTQEDPIIGLYEIRSSLPDIILLDINLPHISGYEMLEILKADPKTKDLPVIALSASAMTSDIEQGLQKGFDEYLTKPLDMNRLLTAFNRFDDKEKRAKRC